LKAAVSGPFRGRSGADTYRHITQAVVKKVYNPISSALTGS
jgi:hypothetical protein